MRRKRKMTVTKKTKKIDEINERQQVQKRIGCLF